GLPILSPEVAPRLVGGEQDPIIPDASALDLGQEPPNPETDRPRGVGVEVVALFHPVEEPRDQADVPAHTAPEVNQVDLHPPAVLLDHRDVVADVRASSGAGVKVEDE